MSIELSTASTGIRCEVHIHLDVEDVERSQAFYSDLFGYELRHVDRKGQLLETRWLTSKLHPQLSIALRQAFGKRVGGSQPGNMLAFGLAVSDLPKEVARLTGRARWVGSSPEKEPLKTRHHVTLLDPDAYVIELYERGTG